MENKFPTHRKILMLQMRHWEDHISLGQANRLRECLYSLERHLFAQYVDKVAKKLTLERKDRKDVKTGITLRSNFKVEDDGKERFVMTDAFGHKHTIKY